MKSDYIDRILAVINYYTFGIFGLIVLILSQFANKKINSFLLYHILQSIFISVILACVTTIYHFLLDLILNFPLRLPIIKDILVSFDVFLNKTPIFFTYSLSGFLIMVLIFYLSILALFGKKSYIPYISDVINSNVR